MSENKKTVSDLQKEYTQLCSKAGHLNYQIKALKDELNLVYESLKVINIEAFTLAASEQSPKVEN